MKEWIPCQMLLVWLVTHLPKPAASLGQVRLDIRDGFQPEMPWTHTQSLNDDPMCFLLRCCPPMSLITPHSEDDSFVINIYLESRRLIVLYFLETPKISHLVGSLVVS